MEQLIKEAIDQRLADEISETTFKTRVVGDEIILKVKNNNVQPSVITHALSIAYSTHGFGKVSWE